MDCNFSIKIGRKNLGNIGNADTLVYCKIAMNQYENKRNESSPKCRKIVAFCGMIGMLSSLQREGGEVVEIIASFALSVVASVEAYYIYKWLVGER